MAEYGPSRQELRIELYSAESQWPEKYNKRDRLVDVIRPGRPRRILELLLDQQQASGGLRIGRDRGGAGTGMHRAWTDLGTGKTEDTQLSRDQLLVECRDGIWQVGVPGPDQKAATVVQYWGSGRNWSLVAGGPPIPLEPDAHVGIVVLTQQRFYWALLTTPPATARSDRAPAVTYPGQRTDPFLRRTTAPRPMPEGWEWAIRVKFEPFLTWPMGWRPVPVGPQNYAAVPPPPTSADDTDPGSRFRPSTSAKSYQEKISRCLDDIKESAMTRGFPAQSPNGIEIDLLEWLSTNGHLHFARHRCEWRRSASG